MSISLDAALKAKDNEVVYGDRRMSTRRRSNASTSSLIT